MAAKKRKRKRNVRHQGAEAPGSIHEGSRAPVPSAEDILEGMEGYRLVSVMAKVSLIGCIISVSGALLLRMNLQGYEMVPLFLNILSYVFAGAVLFLWIARLRPMRKAARLKAAEQAATSAQAPVEDAPPGVSDTGETPVIDGSPEYLRVRRIWRVLLVSAGVLVIAATFSLTAFPEHPAIAVTLQMLALIPVAAAVFLYRTKLKPLKEEWQRRKP